MLTPNGLNGLAAFDITPGGRAEFDRPYLCLVAAKLCVGDHQVSDGTGRPMEGNTATGNGLAGITVHSHSPGEDLNGNVLKGNVFGTDDLEGDPDFGGNTPPAIDPSTTGIIVATAVSPISITIVGNRIANDVYGIWMTPGVTASTAHPANTFVRVTTPIFTAL